MNIIKRLRWSLGHGNPVVPSRWRATSTRLNGAGSVRAGTVVDHAEPGVAVVRPQWSRLGESRNRYRSLAQKVDAFTPQWSRLGESRNRLPRSGGNDDVSSLNGAGSVRAGTARTSTPRWQKVT